MVHAASTFHITLGLLQLESVLEVKTHLPASNCPVKES